MCFQGKLQGTRGGWSLHIIQWKNQCQSYRAARSHTAAWIRSYTDFKSSLHSKLTFWNAKTEYEWKRVELCSNHQRDGIPKTLNHQWNNPTLLPTDNHSRFCSAADLPSSPLLLKPSVSHVTCWGLREDPQCAKEPVLIFLSLNSVPLLQVCTAPLS